LLALFASVMSTRVYVGGLSHRSRERDLEKLFQKYGKIREVSLKNGYAFVEFDDDRDADDAVHELSGRTYMGDRCVLLLTMHRDP
jgi:arginine/serine-rich splicing factor 4/5/6